MKTQTCLLKYRGEKGYHVITRSRAAYLFRAARSRHSKVTRLGETTRRIEDCAVIITA